MANQAGASAPLSREKYLGHNPRYAGPVVDPLRLARHPLFLSIYLVTSLIGRDYPVILPNQPTSKCATRHNRVKILLFGLARKQTTALSASRRTTFLNSSAVQQKNIAGSHQHTKRQASGVSRPRNQFDRESLINSISCGALSLPKKLSPLQSSTCATDPNLRQPHGL